MQLEDGESYEGLTLRDEALAGRRLRMIGFRAVRLVGCDLSNAEWERPALYDVAFERCRLTGFRMTQARGAGVVFSDCQAQYLQLEGCKVERLRFERCLAVEASFMRSRLPGVVFVETDLTSAVMSGCSLAGGDLRGCRIGGIRAQIADFAGTTVDSEQAAALLKGEAGIEVRPL